MRGTILVRAMNRLVDVMGLGASWIERTLARTLEVPASRFLRMRRSVDLLVSDTATPGRRRIVEGTYQAPILVQWRPATGARRQVNVAVSNSSRGLSLSLKVKARGQGLAESSGPIRPQVSRLTPRANFRPFTSDAWWYTPIMRVVSAPTDPSPITRPSTERTGTTSAPVPHIQTSRAVQTSVSVKRDSAMVTPRSRASR